MFFYKKVNLCNDNSREGTWHLHQRTLKSPGIWRNMVWGAGEARAELTRSPAVTAWGPLPVVVCRRVSQSIQAKGPKGRPLSLCWQHWGPDPGKWKRGACSWLGWPRYHPFNPTSKMGSLLSLSPKHKCFYKTDWSTSVVRILKIMPSPRPGGKLLGNQLGLQVKLVPSRQGCVPFPAQEVGRLLLMCIIYGLLY